MKQILKMFLSFYLYQIIFRDTISQFNPNLEISPTNIYLFKVNNQNHRQ